MEKNNEYVINSIVEATGCDLERANAINNILNEHFIIGHNNKEKIVKDFEETFNMSCEEADELYNKCAEIIVKGVFKK